MDLSYKIINFGALVPPPPTPPGRLAAHITPHVFILIEALKMLYFVSTYPSQFGFRHARMAVGLMGVVSMIQFVLTHRRHGVFLTGHFTHSNTNLLHRLQLIAAREHNNNLPRRSLNLTMIEVRLCLRRLFNNQTRPTSWTTMKVKTRTAT